MITEVINFIGRERAEREGPSTSKVNVRVHT